MMHKSWVLSVAVSLGLATLAACGPDTSPQQPSASVGTAMQAPLASKIAAAPLTDELGRAVKLSSFGGKILVISDTMTLCQETCPLDTAAIVSAARATERAGLGDKVEFVSLTVDPGRDTPVRLAAYRKLFTHPPKDWTLLTGDSTAVHSVLKALGVYTKTTAENKPPAVDWMTGKKLTYDVEHSDEVFFVDAEQQVRFLLEGPPHIVAGDPLPAKIKTFMNVDGLKNLNHPKATDWTVNQALQVVSWLAGTNAGSA